MMDRSAPGSPVPDGLLGTLGSWMLTWSREIWPVPDRPAARAAATPAPSFGTARVLVVDDNPVNLMLISALMEAKGLVPLLASDGAEAVALAAAKRFDLILMDLHMPVLDGLEATAAIRRAEAAGSRPAVPVIAYSSLALDGAVLASHGINGRLNKPCDDQELEVCLLHWCPAHRPALPLPRGHEHLHPAAAGAHGNVGSQAAC